jgi:hypothetical protein
MSLIRPIAVLSLLLLGPPVAAQTTHHVEIAALAADVQTNPVSLTPIAPLTIGPSAPTRMGHVVNMLSFGLSAGVYVAPRVQGTVQWSRSLARSSDAPPLPLPPMPLLSFVLLIRATEHVARTAIGARVDLLSRDRVRAWVGGGLQVEHRTGIQTDFVRSDFHGTGETTTHEFEHTTTYPVVTTGLTVYPAVHLLVFGGLRLRAAPASDESAVYRTAPLTPQVGLGVRF